MLKAVLWEADENHLRVALIQPGGSRYEQMKVAENPDVRLKCKGGAGKASDKEMWQTDEFATRVEPRILRPLQ